MRVLLPLAAVSGLLLFASDFPLHLWWLQLVALLPLLYGLRRSRTGWGASALAGLTVGACYVAPLLVVLEFPLGLGAGLGLYIVAVWLLITLGARAVQSWPTPLGPLAVAAMASAVEWLDMSVVPVWGTAQVFTRVWSAAPPAAQLVSLTGVLGLVFAVTALQALLVSFACESGRGRRRAALALGGLLVLVVGLSALLWRQHSQPVATVRVAAVGWTHAQMKGRHWRATLAKLLTPAARRAVRGGAKLVVTPEVAFRASNLADKRALLATLGKLARELQVTFVAGYFDRPAQSNRIAFWGPTGRLRGHYTKTHLIPYIERYRPGDGSTTLVSLTGASPAPRLGGLICQDDNFTDLARALGRRGAQIVAVPTNDWAQVKHYHLENAIFRAIENRYAVVRAASNGISAIFDSRGQLLASRDHFREGPGEISADLPVGSGGPTLYSTLGDWWAGVCALLLAIGAVVFRGRPQNPMKPKTR